MQEKKGSMSTRGTEKRWRGALEEKDEALNHPVGGLSLPELSGVGKG